MTTNTYEAVPGRPASVLFSKATNKQMFYKEIILKLKYLLYAVTLQIFPEI